MLTKEEADKFMKEWWDLPACVDVEEQADHLSLLVSKYVYNPKVIEKLFHPPYDNLKESYVMDKINELVDAVNQVTTDTSVKSKHLLLKGFTIIKEALSRIKDNYGYDGELEDIIAKLLCLIKDNKKKYIEE